MEVQWSDGSKKMAKVLVDSGCETTFLVGMEFAPQKIAYKSSRPLSFVTANPNVSLSGGTLEVGATLTCTGGQFTELGVERPMVSLEIPVAMYVAGISGWDIIMGHEALAHLCISHWARFGLLRLHHPHTPWWLRDLQEETSSLPRYEVTRVDMDDLHPGQVDIQEPIVKVQQLGRKLLTMEATITSNGLKSRCLSNSRSDRGLAPDRGLASGSPDEGGSEPIEALIVEQRHQPGSTPVLQHTVPHAGQSYSAGLSSIQEGPIQLSGTVEVREAHVRAIRSAHLDVTDTYQSVAASRAVSAVVVGYVPIEERESGAPYMLTKPWLKRMSSHFRRGRPIGRWTGHRLPALVPSTIGSLLLLRLTSTREESTCSTLCPLKLRVLSKP